MWGMMDSFWKSVLLYIVLVVMVRIMGKRQIGQLEPSEFVITMVVADLATLPMQGQPLSAGLVPMATLLVMEMGVAFLSMRFMKFRKLLCGKPVILMENGEMNQENMRKTKVTIDELASHLRQKDVLNPEQVQYAILETDGNLSVFLEGALPVTLVADGVVLEENLKKMGRDRRWLDKTLKKYKADPQSTWLFTLDQNGKEVFYRKHPRNSFFSL